jgi:hypothetical protein
MHLAYTNDRKVITLTGLQWLCLHTRRCGNPACNRCHRLYRPEEEGRFGLPQHKFALNVIALIGASRCQQHHSVPEIHQDLRSRGVDSRTHRPSGPDLAPANCRIGRP